MDQDDRRSGADRMSRAPSQAARDQSRRAAQTAPRGGRFDEPMCLPGRIYVAAVELWVSETEALRPATAQLLAEDTIWRFETNALHAHRPRWWSVRRRWAWGRERRRLRVQRRRIRVRAEVLGVVPRYRPLPPGATNRFAGFWF